MWYWEGWGLLSRGADAQGECFDVEWFNVKRFNVEILILPPPKWQKNVH